MSKFNLQEVLLRMITRPLNYAEGVYYKIRWEKDAGLWDVIRARLPRDHDKITPYPAGEMAEKHEFILGPRGKHVIESEFWWKPGVACRKKSHSYRTDKHSSFASDEVYYSDRKKILDEQGRVESVMPYEQAYGLKTGAYLCASENTDDAFFCDPVNVMARYPDLTIVNEHHYLRPLALDLKLEVLGEGSHLGRTAVLVKGVPRTPEEQEELVWVGWWGVPDDWWLVCDYYEMALDMESGLLLYYRGVVGSKTMVQSEMLELVFDPLEVLSESIFGGRGAGRPSSRPTVYDAWKVAFQTLLGRRRGVGLEIGLGPAFRIGDWWRALWRPRR